MINFIISCAKISKNVFVQRKREKVKGEERKEGPHMLPELTKVCQCASSPYALRQCFSTFFVDKVPFNYKIISTDPLSIDLFTIKLLTILNDILEAI